MTDISPTGQLTEEQREQLLRAVAKLATEAQAAMQAMAAAVAPALQAFAQQFAELQKALQSAGLLDAEGRPTALGCAYDPPCVECQRRAAGN